jgi:hypothetical protein
MPTRLIDMTRTQSKENRDALIEVVSSDVGISKYVRSQMCEVGVDVQLRSSGGSHLPRLYFSDMLPQFLSSPTPSSSHICPILCD